MEKKNDERKRSMPSQRTPEQLKTIILKTTQHLVAVGGMQNFSYPKLAAKRRKRTKNRPTPIRCNHGKTVFYILPLKKYDKEEKQQ